jgi:hypothetical protein
MSAIRARSQAGRRRRVDAVEELARLGRFQHRRFAGLHDVLRTAHRRGRIHRQDLAHHKPIEQVVDRGEALFDARRRHDAHLRLDPGRDMQRRNICERRHAGIGAPTEEFSDGAAVGAAGVRIADVGGEEFQKTDAGVVTGGGDQDRNEAGMGGSG